MKRILLIILFLVAVIFAKAQTDSAWLSELSGASIAQKDTIKFTDKDVPPDFPGGPDMFYRYVKKHMKKGDYTTAKVIVTFIIEKDGSVSNVKVLRSPGEPDTSEALRIVQDSPKWNPGMQNDKPVRVQYTLPIAFEGDGY